MTEHERRTRLMEELRTALAEVDRLSALIAARRRNEPNADPALREAEAQRDIVNAHANALRWEGAALEPTRN